MPSQAVAAGAVAPRAQARTVRAFFFITAPADPGLLPRLIEPVAKLGAVPTPRARLRANRATAASSASICRLTGVAPRMAELVEYALRAVVGVRQVMAVIEPEA